MERLVYLVLIVALTLSCSIKEDRTECPCRLVLDFSEIDTTFVKSLDVLATHEGEIVFRDRVPLKDFENEFIRDVPHGDVRLSVWYAYEGHREKDICQPYQT